MTASIRRTPTTPDRQSVRSNTNFYTFCPGGRNVGTRCCAVKELYQVSRLAAFRQHLEECLEYPGATEPPKPLPYAVPFAIFPRECAPRYAVHSEVVNGF